MEIVHWSALPYDLPSSIFYLQTARRFWPCNTGLLLLAKVHHRANFDRAVARAWALSRPVDRLVEIVAIERVVAAELLFGFGKRAVRGHPLTVLHPHRGGRRGRMQRLASNHHTGLLQGIGV